MVLVPWIGFGLIVTSPLGFCILFFLSCSSSILFTFSSVRILFSVNSRHSLNDSREEQRGRGKGENPTPLRSLWANYELAPMVDDASTRTMHASRKMPYPTRWYQPIGLNRRKVSVTGPTTMLGSAPNPGARECAFASA